MKGAAYKEQEQTYNQYFANRLQLRFEEEKQLNNRNFVLVTNLFGAQSYHVSCVHAFFALSGTIMLERSSGLAPLMTLRSMALKRLRKENLRVVRGLTAALDRFII